TLGRRPYNDIVVDNLAVSGEHAVFVRHPDGLEVQDLHSTNGTYLNGKAVVSARVGAGDLLEIGRYQMRVLPDATDSAPAEAPPTAPASAAAQEPPLAAPAPAQTATPAAAAPAAARIQVLNGPAAGKAMTLTKVVTTLGKPGVAVAAINHRGDGYT
ncbi:FHA domain-containing protein, partial [Aquabacterium sp. A08]|uniref:FHA domain-containing protein n=1 Tax=Aquabacterium sp. A08 TaxID=2718532 RepID=UPI0014207FD3